MTANGYRVSFGNDESVLKLYSDDGCTTLQIYYKTPNSHLKIKY